MRKKQRSGLVVVVLQSARDSSLSLPLTMVGTKPIVRPAARWARDQARMAALSVMISGVAGMATSAEGQGDEKE